MRSSLKMMRIQPKAEAIKSVTAHLKATDPKRAEMNTETMALYKARASICMAVACPCCADSPLLCLLSRFAE